MKTYSRITVVVFVALSAAASIGVTGVAGATPTPKEPASAESAGENVACSSGNHCVFYAGFDSAKHSFPNSDTNFSTNTFNQTGLNGGDDGLNEHIDNNIWSASNNSTGGYESHYYYGANYSGGLVFCVNPGRSVDYTRLTDDGIDGNGVGQRDEASSLRLRPTTTITCFN